MVALRPARVRVELPESVEKLLEVAHAAIARDLQALSALSRGTSLILTSTSLQPYHVPELYGVEQNAVLVADFELHTVDLFLLEDHLGHHLFGRPPSLASCVFQRRKVHALDVSLVDVVGFDMEKNRISFTSTVRIGRRCFCRPATCSGMPRSGRRFPCMQELKRRPATHGNALYRAAIEALPACLNAKDQAGRFRVANPATADLMGRPSKSSLGGRRGLLRSVDGRTVPRTRGGSHGAGRTPTVEQRFLRRDVVETWLLTLKAPLRDEARRGYPQSRDH